MMRFIQQFYQDCLVKFALMGKCLAVLRMYNMKPDGQPLFPYLHYERLEHSFHTGEVLRNMNGNDYRVLAALSPENLLLMAQKDSQIIVGRGVQFYGRYPKDERPDSDSMVTGIEWDHGVYLGNDITKIDFDILKQEYGEPDRVKSVYGLRGKGTGGLLDAEKCGDEEGCRAGKECRKELSENTLDP